MNRTVQSPNILLGAKEGAAIYEEDAFGNWVSQSRNELNLTLEELALRISYSQDYIKKIERGLRYPSRQIVQLLSEALQIPLSSQARNPPISYILETLPFILPGILRSLLFIFSINWKLSYRKLCY